MVLLLCELHSIKDCDLPRPVTVRGWVKTCRTQGKMTFIELEDGSCTEHLQIVHPQRVSAGTGCGMLCRGTLKLSPKDGQRLELFVPKSEKIVLYPHEPSPVSKTDLSDDFFRSIPHLRTKRTSFAAMARIRHSAMMAIHDFFDKHHFVCVHTPLITGSDCEGAGEAFHVMDSGELKERVSGGQVDDQSKFFRKDVYLTVSGQLHVEASCLALSRVYTFGPTFRAEHSKTTRHLSEFWMIEPEMVCDTLDELMDLTESFVKYVVKMVYDKYATSGWLRDGCDVEQLVEEDFKRITYTDAIDFLQKSEDVKEPPQWGDDLSTEHEKVLTMCFGTVFVTKWPAKLKSFYMKATEGCESGKETVECMDLLVAAAGELIGGSMREDDYDILLSKMQEKGMDISEYQWYLVLRKYGTMPHGGFGMGFERLLMYLTDKQVRDTIQFPRTHGKCDM